ncbi:MULTISPECIES: helix-turn-helix domain-containing protein [Silvimonas]|uniref:helix-turn-helix domain-containing protein n=1 Tax=Silvimonas TaxID=300264 RepID=UPI0024B3A3E0|nr:MULTISPECIES: XRE family transcriptional regulator [Silvimonas]MDR3426927.1 XRE family transcriptional regulator [Silvimonas sp.]
MDINTRIAARVSGLRKARNMSLDALASSSDVSRSMISLIERGQSNATAVVLEKLAVALGVTLASLFEDQPATPAPLIRRHEQPEWRDPQSGYLRRNISPPGVQSPIQIVEVIFPAGARVAYESSTREPRVHQQIWLLKGRIDVTVGEEVYAMSTGDCLAFELKQATAFFNPHHEDAHYAVVISN